MRVTRDQLVDYTDTIFHDASRLGVDVIRELQDAHNVNLCDGNDETWFDGDELPQDQNLTILSESEFLETYVF
jgi:hypothetical protein